MIEKVLSFATNPLKKQIETTNDKLIIPAWRLVENAWLKWFDIWWVKVSEKHANFISNYANKAPQKIIDLKNMIQERVKETFWCILEPEVIIY
jgi:UDP-N-acetylenolpyruvoylglucosamine reductase